MAQQPLQITVVGAGIGGLCAAIGLRQQGHNVKIFEQSRLAREIGAALHIAPNCNGLLHRLGINPRKYGSLEMLGMTSFAAGGSTISSKNMSEDNKAWQHPWDLIHRAHLHNALQDRATSSEGPGQPIELHTASRVAFVDSASGSITLENGQQYKADLVIGADGVHSVTRKAICDLEPYDSGQSAYRFLVDTKEMAKHDKLKSLLGYDQHFFIWIGKDRRMVMYPCEGGATMNLAGMFPSKELKAEGDGWAKTGTNDNLLKCFESFDERVRILIELADKPQAWTLLDMDKVPTFIKDKLVLLADACHPFLPHQGQGAAQAIEDGMSLAAVLPLGTTKEDISDRLKIYERQRYERSHKVQEFTRLTGQDAGEGPPPNFTEFVPYNVGHDEWHASIAAVDEHLAATSSQRWHQPPAFGAMPALDCKLRSRIAVRFKSSRTYLQTLLPGDVTFSGPATVCDASFICDTINGSWLQHPYHSFSLCIHGVQRDDVPSTFTALTFVDSADVIAVSNEAKQYCAIDVGSGEQATLKLSWNGAEFGRLTIEDLERQDAPEQEEGEQCLTWDRAERGSVDAMQPQFERVSSVERSKEAHIEFFPLSQGELLTLHGIVDAMAKVPLYSITSVVREAR